MRLQRFAFISCIACLFIAGTLSCKKDKVLSSGGELRYSLDTMSFDTVFTATGTFTTQVKLYNPQSQKVNISAIRLGGANASFFHINVNGFPGDVTNMELAAKDSMYIFATVNINPDNRDNPFVVNANITATMNGKEYVLPLMAYGQNAHYIIDSTLDETKSAITWGADDNKPYVIVHNAAVAENQTLTIKPGCRVYVNGDSRLFVLGTLKAIGTKKDSIIFQGDRLDRNYFGNEGYPGEWGGIYFAGNSKGNELDHVIIRNGGSSTSLGGQGILPAAVQVNPDSFNIVQLTMKNTVIENSLGYGLLCFSSNVVAQNCLINGCGAQTVITNQGGKYRFDNCNFSTYGSNKISHIDQPAVAVVDFFKNGEVTYVSNLDAVFTNCVIWGSLDNECFVQKKGNGDYKAEFINCVIKQAEGMGDATKVQGRINTDDPKFKDGANWDFHLLDGSPMINAGVSNGISTDLDDKVRDGSIDIGCYER